MILHMVLYMQTGVEQMERSTVRLKKQPKKYLAKLEINAYKKLRKALNDLEEWRDDIKKLRNSDFYRLKIPQYRIIFTFDGEINVIDIEESTPEPIFIMGGIQNDRD